MINKPRKHPNSIKKTKRLEWLESHRHAGLRYCIGEKQRARRKLAYSQFKKGMPPACSQLCYVCDLNAIHWHHIVHLSKGGANNLRNLVPLCKSCHKKVHRFDPTRNNRRPGQSRKDKKVLSNLEGKIAYIPPKGSLIAKIDPFDVQKENKVSLLESAMYNIK